MDKKTSEFTITKRIAKHGKQAVIVIPKILSSQLKPSAIVRLHIEVIQEAEEDARSL